MLARWIKLSNLQQQQQLIQMEIYRKRRRCREAHGTLVGRKPAGNCNQYTDEAAIDSRVGVPSISITA